jgi:hypothetical protein
MKRIGETHHCVAFKGVGDDWVCLECGLGMADQPEWGHAGLRGLQTGPVKYEPTDPALIDQRPYRDYLRRQEQA